MEIIIRPLTCDETAPYDLLLLADPSREIVDEYLNRGVCFVSESNNEIVGEFVLIPTVSNTMEIINIAVKEEYQGRGISKSLIEKAIDEAKKLKVKTIEIGTGNSSVGQLLLYQKCGFRISGIEKDYFINNYAEEIYEN